MGKKIKATRHMSIRLSEDVAGPVTTMAGLADWSESRIINHFIRLAIAAGNGDREAAGKCIQEYRHAVGAHAIRSEAADRIKALGRQGSDMADQMMLVEAFDHAEVKAIGEKVSDEELENIIAAVDPSAVSKRWKESRRAKKRTTVKK